MQNKRRNALVKYIILKYLTNLLNKNWTVTWYLSSSRIWIPKKTLILLLQYCLLYRVKTHPLLNILKSVIMNKVYTMLFLVDKFIISNIEWMFCDANVNFRTYS